jgi:fermentation-respiration switch protein FrsA (DUF1100 family)
MTSTRLLALLGTAAVLLVALLLLIWMTQRQLIYLPMQQHVPPAAELLSGATDVSFDTEDGLTLRAWFVPPDSGGSGPTVLVLPGNAGNRSMRAPLARALSHRGMSVLLVDYRGYGGNPGKPTESGLLADARAARVYLESRPDVDPSRIVYFGESLGAAVALAAAIERPPAALVLRSPFTSMTDVAALHYPFLPVRLLLLDRYPSGERIGGLRCPLLVLAGSQDGIVPPDQSRSLFEAAPVEARRFLVIDGAGHNDYDLLAGERMIAEIARFTGEYAGRPGAAADASATDTTTERQDP